MNEFQKKKRQEIIEQRNVAIFECIVYAASVLILFGLGGKISELATRHVPLISIDGIIKIVAIVSFIILIAIIIIPGPIIVMSDVDKYYKLRD